MGDTKISALTAASAAALANEIPINEAGTSKKLTVQQTLNAVNLLTAASSIVGADITLLIQSAVAKAMTLTQLQAFIMKATAGVATSPTASQTDAITHGLGKTPTIIRIWGVSGFVVNNSALPAVHSFGIWCSSGNRCIYQPYDPATITLAEPAATSTTFAIRLDTGVGNNMTGIIQNVGATTFDIAWTESGTHTAQPFMWEAQ